MEAGGHDTTSKPIKNMLLVVCFVFGFISRLNFPSRRIAHTLCNLSEKDFL